MNRKLHVNMTREEILGGWILFFAELLLFPWLIRLGNQLFPGKFSDAIWDFLLQGLCFLAVIVIFRRFLADSLRILSHRFQKFFGAVLTGLILDYALSALVSGLIARHIPGFQNANDQMLGTMLRSTPVLAVSILLFVPLTEECIYRGLFFAGLYPKSRALAYLVSIAVFAAVHVLGYIGTVPGTELLAAFVQYLPAGLALCWAYQQADSVFAPVLIHTLVNAIGIYTVLR